MSRIFLSLFSTALLAGASMAQSSAQAQAGASVSESSSVSAGQSGAQAQSQTGAQAATQGALASKSGSQSAQASESSQASSSSAVHATLMKPVDAHKNKAGDEVVAKTNQDMMSNGQVMVPKGSRIIGHVTEAKAKSSGQAQSSMGIAFDRAILKDGREVPISASIQAIASAQQTASAAASDDSMMAGAGAEGMASSGGAVAARGAASGAGLVGGATRAVGSTGGTLVNTAAGAGTGLSGVGSAASATGALSSNSRGVIGMNGLQLASTTASSAQGSLITSTQHNVHLDSGTQMILLMSGK